MYKIICESCGHEKTTLLNELTENSKCSLCNSQMKLTQESLKDIIHLDCINKMKKNIEKLGEVETWDIIERNIVNPISRLKYRDLFFKAKKELETL